MHVETSYCHWSKAEKGKVSTAAGASEKRKDSPVPAANCSTNDIDRVRPEIRLIVSLYLDELLD